MASTGNVGEKPFIQNPVQLETVSSAPSAPTTPTIEDRVAEQMVVRGESIVSKFAGKVGEQLQKGWSSDRVFSSFDVEKFSSVDQCDKEIRTCRSKKKHEQLKAVGKGAIAVIATAFLLSASFTIMKFATYIFGFVLLPLIVIPPLYMTLVPLGGAAAGAYFGMKTIPPIWNELMAPAKEHWHLASHLGKEITKIEERKIFLLSEKITPIQVSSVPTAEDTHQAQG